MIALNYPAQNSVFPQADHPDFPALPFGDGYGSRHSVVHMSNQGMDLALLDGQGNPRIRYSHQRDARRVHILSCDQKRRAELEQGTHGCWLKTYTHQGPALTIRLHDCVWPGQESSESLLTPAVEREAGWDVRVASARCRVYMEEQSPRLTLLDSVGRDRMTCLAGSDENWIHFYSPSRQKRATLSALRHGAQLRIFDIHGQARAILHSRRQGALLQFADADGRHAMGLEFQPDAGADTEAENDMPPMELRIQPEFRLTVGKGAMAMTLRMDSDCVRLSGSYQNQRFMLRLDEACVAGLVDEQGRMRSLIRLTGAGPELCFLDAMPPSSVVMAPARQVA